MIVKIFKIYSDFLKYIDPEKRISWIKNIPSANPNTF